MATTLPSPPVPSSGDGRTRRAARSRMAIERALFELVGEGIPQPTAQEVATRAGVAARSVFRHFSDLESLFASIDARLRLEVAPLVRDARPTESLRVRVRELVRQRATLFEHIAPYKRSAELQRGRSAFIQSQQRRQARELRAGLLRWLPELAAVPADVREAVDLVTSFEAWARLRSEQRLGREWAVTVMERTVAALLLPGARTPRKRSSARL